MNGIGGRTIGEAQENMTYPEFMVWCKFRRKRGSLHTGMRIETAIAQLQAFYANCRSGKNASRIYTEDFAPHMDERPIELADALLSWS